LIFAKGVEGANVFTKADVNGPNARPTYKYLKEKGVLTDVAWNFAGKFLVDKEGNGKSLRITTTIFEMNLIVFNSY
jgi:glutathione peroxidase-family protein